MLSKKHYTLKVTGCQEKTEEVLKIATAPGKRGSGKVGLAASYRRRKQTEKEGTSPTRSGRGLRASKNRRGWGLWRASALEDAGQLEEKPLVGDGTDELEADGETGGDETAGNGDGGDAGEIGGAIVAEEEGTHGVILVADADDFLADQGSSDWRGWDDESVDR